MNGQYQITIIIPVHNGEKYLSECLESVVRQEVVKFEIIAIDDCSTDRSLEILEGYSDKYPFIKIIRNKKKLRQGPSRNIGLDNARGRYIQFLDADDYLEGNALFDIMTRVDEEDPDLVFFNHYLMYEDGRREEAKQQHLFKEPYIDDIDELKKRSLNIFHVPWNKVYKKAFLDEISFRYPAGSYEDIFCSFKALLDAKKICLMDQAIYNYRLRPGTVTGKPNRKTDSVRHDDVFKRYDELFEYLQGDQEGKKYLPYFYIRMLHQLSGVLCVRLPEDSQVRHRFFRKMVQYSKIFDPGVYDYLNYRTRINHYLIKHEQMNVLIFLNSIYTKLISLKP